MVKTTIKEITEKFDKNGTLIERLTREEFIEDDEKGLEYISTNPNLSKDSITIPFTPCWYEEPYCITKSETIPVDAELTTKAEAFNSINEIINKTETISTENAFKQAVSKCINTK